MKSKTNYTTFILLALVFLFGPAAPSFSEQAANDENIWFHGVYHYQNGINMTPIFPGTDEAVELMLRVNKDDLTAVKIRYWDGSEHFIDMLWDHNDDEYGYWKGIIPASTSQVYYRFKLIDGNDVAWYNSKGMVEDAPFGGDFTYFPVGGNLAFETPDWVRHAVFYQIFPERFYNGNPSNDPAGSSPWGSIPTTKNFMGGDLRGVIDKLDYLNDGNPETTDDLGITALYLNPIFESRTNHKYSTEDYENVDDNFGDNTVLSELITEAHQRGIKIILDGVFNHTGVGHPFFDDVLKHGATSPYYKYYDIKKWPIRWYDDLNDNGIKDQNEPYFHDWRETTNDQYLRTNDYDAWWGYAHLPNLTTTEKGLRDYFINDPAAIAVRWLQEGIDGWRLDVANEIENDFWKAFRQRTKGVRGDAYIVGEVWDNASKWLDGTMWDSTMNYRFRGAAQNFFAGMDDDGNGSQTNVDEFDRALYAIKSDYKVAAYSTALNLLESHDTWRFLNRCGGDWTKMAPAVIFQMTYCGAPMIYYGAENGMAQWPGAAKDPGNRSAMEWGNYRNTNREEINKLYRNLIRIRHSHPALRSPHVRTLYRHNADRIYAFARHSAEETIVVVINNSTFPKKAEINIYGLWPDGTKLLDKLSEGSYTVASGKLILNSIPPRGAHILGVPATDYSDIVINEFLPVPSLLGSEWIELYNKGAAAVDVSACMVDDVVGQGGAAYTLPSGTSIPPQGFLVIQRYFLLNNNGDTPNLLDPAGRLIDSYKYTGSPGRNVSIGRAPDGENIWGALKNPTPGKVNSSLVNVLPKAAFNFLPARPIKLEEIEFDASGTSDLDGTLVQYEWDWQSDGTFDARGKKVIHEFAQGGAYRVTLCVTDNSGAKGEISRKVKVDTEERDQGFYGTTNSFAEENLYFLLTDRFVNGNTGNDHSDQGFTNNNPTWEGRINGPNGKHANIGYMGGDFEGIYKNGDYIKEMGFTSIWITPIVDNPDEAFTGGTICRYGAGVGSDGGKTGYHGYWGVNFYKVDEHYESDGFSFAEFTTKMRNDHGLKIVLDIVCNHGSPSYSMPQDQPKFGELYDGNIRLVADHENLHPSSLDHENPLHKFYNKGGGLAELSDLKENNAAVLDYLVCAYRQWIDQGAYAFRIDTIAWMPHTFWKAFSDEIRKEASDFFMFGENFNYNAAVIAQHQKPKNGGISVLDFPVKALVNSLFSKGGSYRSLEGSLHLTDGTYVNPYELVTFYENHDMARMAAGPDGFIDANNWLFTARGIPCIYYGSEKGFMAGRREHEGNRNYYGTENIVAAKSNEIYRRLSKIANIRKNSPALQKGLQVKVSLAEDTASFYRVFQYEDETETALVLLNKGDSPANFTIMKYMSNGIWTDAYSGDEYDVTSNKLKASVPPHDVKVLVLADPVNNDELVNLLHILMTIRGEKVKIQPDPALAGREVNVSYRGVAGQQIECHWGINNWNGTGTPQGDIPMAWNSEHLIYECVLPVPPESTMLDMVFHNLTNASWDNNGGADWHFDVR